MAQDDWLMGALAAQDAYRGDEPQWPPAPMGSLAEFTSREPPLPTHPPERPLTKAERVLGAMGQTFRAIPGGIAGMAQDVRAAAFQPPGTRREDYTDEPAAPQPTAPLSGLGADVIMAGLPFSPKGALGMAGGKIVQSPKMGEVAEPIRAYHSSPHDFEKFDLSKIGTGQGAQSYGHGIYLAENPAVSGQGGQYWQEFARHPTIGKTERDAADFLALHNFDRQAAAKQTRAQLERNADFAKGINSPEELASRVSENAEFEKVVRLLESGRPVGPRTYEVGIHAPREAFLDWDKPLAPKTPVRGILADLGMKGTGSPYADIRNVSKDAFLAAQNPSLTGEGAYRSLARAAVRPEDVRPGFSAHSPTMASEALREAGIPGVKYLDQGSRNYPGNLPAQIASEKLQLHGTPEAAIASLEKYPHAYLKDEHKAAADLLRAGPLPESKGTSNFVVWSPEIIQIMRKYGLAGAVPAGMGALAAQDRYAEQ